MNKAITTATTISFRNWGEFFSSPIIAGLAQSNPITAGVSAFVISTYQQQQYEAMQEFMEMLNARTRNLEENAINQEFLTSPTGQRILGKALRSVIRDNRKEKIVAMANLTVNLFIDRGITVDEKELYVDILDVLNSLQLSILERAVGNMRARTGNKHRGLGWEILAKDYEKTGISKPLFLQSIRALESNGLINQNNATIHEQDQTHFITDFGEQFYDYISDELLKKINAEEIKEL